MKSYNTCLPLYDLMPSKFIRIVTNGKMSFFLWLNIISLYTCTTTSLSVHPAMNTYTVSMHWLLWARGCSCPFNVVFSFPSDIFPEVRWLDCMGALFLILWGASILFSTVVASISNPLRVHKDYLFSTSSSEFTSHVSDDRHSNWHDNSLWIILAADWIIPISSTWLCLIFQQGSLKAL